MKTPQLKLAKKEFLSMSSITTPFLAAFLAFRAPLVLSLPKKTPGRIPGTLPSLSWLFVGTAPGGFA